MVRTTRGPFEPFSHVLPRAWAEHLLFLEQSPGQQAREGEDSVLAAGRFIDTSNGTVDEVEMSPRGLWVRALSLLLVRSVT